jgi:hypothetical protein
LASGQRAHLGCCQGNVGRHGLEDDALACLASLDALEGPSIRTPFFHKLARNITDKLLHSPPPPPPPRIDLGMETSQTEREETSQTSLSSATSNNKALSAHVKPCGPGHVPCSIASPYAPTSIAPHASLLHAQEEDGDKVREAAECREGGEAVGGGEGEGMVMMEESIQGGDKGPTHWLWHEASRVSPRHLGRRPRLARDLKRVPEVYESSLCLHMLYFSWCAPTAGVGTNNSLALALAHTQNYTDFVKVV